MYDFTAYDFTHCEADRFGPRNAPAWMDARHVLFLYNTLMVGKFKCVLEIGCYNGSSTSAMVQALADGSDFELHLCDIEFRPILLQLLSRMVKRPILHKCRGAEIIGSDFDFVIVDGDHSLPVVSEEVALLLKAGTPTIAAHDITHMGDGYAGASYLASTLKEHGYLSIEDSRVRPGEWTERGFGLYTKRRDLYDVLSQYSFD